MRTHKVLFYIAGVIIVFVKTGYTFLHDPGKLLHDPTFPRLPITQQERDADAADRAAHKLLFDINFYGVHYSFIPDALTIDAGRTTKLGYQLLTTAGRRIDDIGQVSWQSSDESVVKVGPHGEISCLRKGSAVISVTATKDNVTGSILVRVV
jgi:hypothetical protein